MSRWPGGTTGVLLVLGVAVSIATWRLAPFAAALWVAIIIMVAGACFSRRLRADRRWLLLFSVMPVVGRRVGQVSAATAPPASQSTSRSGRFCSKACSQTAIVLAG